MSVPMPRYVSCPTHGYRLCPVYDQDFWQRYAEAVGEIIRQQWAERQLLLLWLGMVEATHRDRATIDTLERVLRTGQWSRRLIDQARQIAELYDADALTA